MSEKKYTSGKAVDAEIQRLLDLKKEMVDKKTKVFTDTISKNGFSEKLVDLSDSDVKEIAKIINSDFDKIIEDINNRKGAKKQKQTPVSEPEATTTPEETTPDTTTVNNQPM